MKIKKISSANGVITVPGDKSISHRAVMLGALADGTSEIYGFLMGEDCLSTIACFRDMGIDIEVNNEKVVVHGKGLHGLSKPEKILYTGNSGTTTRLLCGILAGQSFEAEITGDASICKRPMKRVTVPLSEMGADINGEYCPILIKPSALHGITYETPVASAQVKTAILLAGMYADGETVVIESEKSRDHTERMLGAMGANIHSEGLRVTIGQTERLKPQSFKVPADISSAAFFMTLAAIMPDSCVTIKNVGVNETRTGIIDVLRDMGADLTVDNVREAGGEQIADITVKTSELHGTQISGEIIPRLIDEIPIIAVAAVFADGETVIRDAQELKVKETNRIRAVVDELKKCGADITETEDGMIIRGGKKVHGGHFLAYGDHRMAMSLAVLAQKAEGESTIDNVSCIDISYPSFFDDLYSLGEQSD
jgi:3-phosphoshikimate 1-carboxyvinyltransferase